MILFVLLLRDGVPGSQSVTEEFALDWPQVLSGTHNVALAWVDGRSGVGRGQKTTAVDSRKLGSLRVKDYLGVVQSVQLRNSIKLYNGHVRVIKTHRILLHLHRLLMQLPYIDDRRMILYGKVAGLFKFGHSILLQSCEVLFLL